MLPICSLITKRMRHLLFSQRVGGGVGERVGLGRLSLNEWPCNLEKSPQMATLLCPRVLRSASEPVQMQQTDVY